MTSSAAAAAARATAAWRLFQGEADVKQVRFGDVDWGMKIEKDAVFSKGLFFFWGGNVRPKYLTKGVLG